jgi:hypothetical protein
MSKKTVTMTFVFDLTWSPQIFSNPSWRLHFSFHIVSINPCFIAEHNYLQKVFILASTIQKFLTDGLSLWSCDRSCRANFETIGCSSNFVIRMSWHNPIDMLHSSTISYTVKQWSEYMISWPCATWASSLDIEGLPKHGSSCVDCQPSLDCLSFYRKRIYQAAVWQKLRTTGLNHS